MKAISDSNYVFSGSQLAWILKDIGWLAVSYDGRVQGNSAPRILTTSNASS